MAFAHNSPTPIAAYLEQLPTESTRRAYRSHLYNCIDALYGRQRAARTCSPDEAARYEDLARALLATPDPASVLPRYVVALADAPPTTAAQRFAVVLDWLSFHGREVAPRERKTLVRRLPKGGPQTLEADLDPETLRAILQHLDVRGRALVLCLASSGMRIGEVLQLVPRDVDLESAPAVVRIAGAYTKTGAPRITFLSAEASAAVWAWLQVRDEREDLAVRRSAGLGGKDRDARLFPFTAWTTQKVWLRAVRKAGLYDVDPATNRATLHLHMLRKYFHSQLKLGCPEEVVEMLMGHEGYLSGSYRRYTRRELAEHYQRGEPYLTVMVPAEYRALTEQTAERLETQRAIVDGLMAKSLHAEARMAELEERAREQDRVIRMLQAVLGAVEADRDQNRGSN